VVDEITRVVIGREVREKRFTARALRVDSTVVEADVRYPNDAALATDATRVLAREAKKLIGLAGAGRRLRQISRSVARRTGEAKTTVLRLTGEAGALVKRSVRETRRLAIGLRERARGRGARAKLAAARRLEELAERAEKIARQIDQRLAGEKITDRLVSMFDPDARPIRKGKLRAPTEFGYVFQLAEITENTRRGARGLLLPAATQLGNPSEDTLLASAAHELERLGLAPRDVALDAGFNPGPTTTALPDAQRVFIAGRQSTGSRRTDRRLAKYRVGCEGRISHLKRGHVPRLGVRGARTERM
jgi:transposase, IS5 family